MSKHEIKKFVVEDEIGYIIRDELENEFCKNYILVGEENTFISEYYGKILETIQNFEIRNDDIIVASYPKAGTTWTQEMVWLIANGLNFKGAEVPILQRFPFLEVEAISDYKKIEQITGVDTPDFIKNSIEFLNKEQNSRFIKTHLPFSLLPDEIQNGTKSPKMIYVMRNPKDVCVSFYHHGKLLNKWKATLETFSKVFLDGKVLYGSYWKHVLGYWGKRTNQNLLIIKYEDMKSDLPSVIKKVANFLEKPITDEQIQLLTTHLSFEYMKKNKAVNFEDQVNFRRKFNLSSKDGEFLRSGTVGKYKEEMSAETIEKFNEWIKKNIGGTSFGQQYDYSL